MSERSTDPNDPKGLIREAYRIEGISDAECRSIFVDWALSIGTDDPRALIETLLQAHAASGDGDHPMTLVLKEGLAEPPRARRRGGYRARRSAD